MNGKKYTLSILVAGLVASSIWLGGCDSATESHAAAEVTPVVEAKVEKRTNVEIKQVTTADVQERFTLPGTLEAWEEVTLGLELSGPIRWIGPEEGQRVAKGELILRIDPETLEAKLEAGRVEFEVAKRQWKRMETLLEKKLVSQQEFDRAREDYELTKSSLTQAQLALDKSTLVSPIDGILDELLVDRGEFGSVGDPAAVLVQVDRLNVIVNVPEKEIAFLATGDRAEIVLAPVEGLEAKAVRGTVTHVAYRADERTRTYRAKVAVDNGKGRMRPGMIVRATFERKKHEQVVTVPLYALVDRDGQKELYVEEDGVARRRIVTAGPIVGERVVIVEGVAPGERLIISGQQLVADGTLVRVVEG